MSDKAVCCVVEENGNVILNFRENYVSTGNVGVCQQQL